MSDDKWSFNFHHLQVSQREHLAVVTINRPDAYNTLTLSVIADLTEVFLVFKQTPEVRVVIIHGSGGEAFVAGADLNEVAALGGLTAVEFARRGQRLFNLIESGPQIVIAAIDGYCMGGGLDLALACHLRYASDRSVFAHPGARLGIITGFGGTARLPRLIGRARALEVFLTGKRFDAREAVELGLVDKVVTSGSVLSAAIKAALKLRNDELRELQNGYI